MSDVEDSGLHDMPIQFQGSILDDGTYLCFEGKPCAQEAEWGHPCSRDINERLECCVGLALVRKTQ